jgi:uncharacterized protein YbcV (DUF1398 family)
MNTEHSNIIHSCVQGALSDAMTFPEIVRNLMDIGIERYHADYSRQEITYYFPDGESLVVPAPHPEHPTASQFSASAIAAAIGQSQRNEHSYLDFIRKTKSAGCVGYFVQIAGRCAVYFGRQGESHVEHFPPAPAGA